MQTRSVAPATRSRGGAVRRLLAASRSNRMGSPPSHHGITGRSRLHRNTNDNARGPKRAAPRSYRRAGRREADPRRCGPIRRRVERWPGRRPINGPMPAAGAQPSAIERAKPPRGWSSTSKRPRNRGTASTCQAVLDGTYLVEPRGVEPPDLLSANHRSGRGVAWCSAARARSGRTHRRRSSTAIVSTRGPRPEV